MQDNKRPRNANGKEHGFWQTYFDGFREFSTHFVNGEPLGYLEYNDLSNLTTNLRIYHAR